MVERVSAARLACYADSAAFIEEDEIPKERYHESLSYLKEGCYCEGEIRGVVLVIVNDMTTEEANNPANKTSYHL